MTRRCIRNTDCDCDPCRVGRAKSVRNDMIMFFALQWLMLIGIVIWKMYR